LEAGVHGTISPAGKTVKYIMQDLLEVMLWFALCFSLTHRHSWAQMVKKTSIGSTPTIDWWQKTSTRLMVVRRKKNHKLMDRNNWSKIKSFSPMIDTIVQTSKIFNRWIDTFSVKHER
jgi:hypothetical protein